MNENGCAVRFVFAVRFSFFRNLLVQSSGTLTAARARVCVCVCVCESARRARVCVYGGAALNHVHTKKEEKHGIYLPLDGTTKPKKKIKGTPTPKFAVIQS